MSYNQTLRSSIQGDIKTPADPKISGAIMQAKLLAIVDAIDNGGVFKGVAGPSTNPVTDQNCFYLATEAGAYTHFLNSNGNALVIVDGEAAILSSVVTQNQTVRWQKNDIITPSTPTGYVAYAVEQVLTPEQISQAQQNIHAAKSDGENPDLVAGDITAKTTVPVETNNVFNIQTTGGDTDLKSGASLLSVIRGNLDSKLQPFYADTFVSTEMNLVDPRLTLSIGARTAYYFPVAKGTWGAYGTTQENNGYIVVGDTPYSVCYSKGKPSVSDYGSALTPVTYNGKNYYTTPDSGWLVVIMNDGSEAPAVHVAWSNYNDAIGGTFDNHTKNILPFVQWIHTWGMAALFGPDYAVFDEIDITNQVCNRRIDRVALNSLTWNMTVETSGGGDDERTEYIYVFTAEVSAMKSNGLFRNSMSGIEVSGKTLTFRSSDITTVPDFITYLGSAVIYFELATAVSRTFAQIGATLTTANTSNDFGLTYFLSNDDIPSVAGYVTEAFYQGGKDQLFNAVTYQKILAEVVASALCQLDERIANLEHRENVECVNLTVKRRASIFGWNEVDAAPASATDPGDKGDYFIASNYIYICVATNTWKRAELSTFTI